MLGWYSDEYQGKELSQSIWARVPMWGFHRDGRICWWATSKQLLEADGLPAKKERRNMK